METPASFVAYGDGIGAGIQVEGMNRFHPKQPAGYIFMCNGRTKPQCYQYRVFGLPSGRRDIAERIKPGAKLFLYDFELKLLYGIYEATTSGISNLEPDAFDGKFPSQVGFRIFKECLPLPEKSFRSAIKDNYTGSKFKQELDEKQVTNLISLFPPLVASSSSLMSRPLPPAASAQEMMSSDSRSQDSYGAVTQNSHDKTQLLSSLYPYLCSLQHSHAPQVMQPPPAQQVQTTATPVEHGYYPTSINSYRAVDSQLVSIIRENQTPNVENLHPWHGVPQVVVPAQQPSSDYYSSLPQTGGETAIHQGTAAAGYKYEPSWSSYYGNASSGYATATNYYNPVPVPSVGSGYSTAPPQAPPSGWPQVHVPTFSSYPSQQQLG